MSTKIIIWICVFLFSIIGGYVPMIFGNSIFSTWSILGNATGGIFGIWIGFKIGNLINGR